MVWIAAGDAETDAFEGDIILTAEQKEALKGAELNENGTRKNPILSKNGIININYGWPNNVLPYVIDASYSKSNLLICRFWVKNCCACMYFAESRKFLQLYEWEEAKRSELSFYY